MPVHDGCSATAYCRKFLLLLPLPSPANPRGQAAAGQGKLNERGGCLRLRRRNGPLASADPCLMNPWRETWACMAASYHEALGVASLVQPQVSQLAVHSCTGLEVCNRKIPGHYGGVWATKTTQELPTLDHDMGVS